MLAGLLVGLIIGVGVAVGLAFYLNKSSTPFSNLERLQPKTVASAPAPEVLAPGAKLATATPPPAPQPVPAPPSTAPSTVPADKAMPQDADGQRFDFYKILPGQQEALPATGKSGASEEQASKPALRLFLQAGAFQSESDADNMKARLALMGVEAKIQSLSLPDKGLIHRVRIGPFERQEDMDALRGKLQQDGVDVSVIKLPAK